MHDEDVRYIRRELKHSSFRRSFQFFNDVLDSKNINANFEDGVLRIEIPKKSPKLPKKYKVEIL